MYGYVFSFMLLLSLNQLVHGRWCRMSGGMPVKSASQFPYLVSLQKTKTGAHFCGGTILTNQIIITAAHCIEYKKPEEIRIAAGGIEKNVGQQYYDIVNMARHRNHIRKCFRKYDFGLLKTSQRIQFSKNVQPISIATQPVPGGSKVQTAGWGILHGSTPEHKLRPTILQWVELTTMNRDKCSVMFNMALQPYHICTAPGKGPCKGDSGGPLIYNGKLLGVISHGRPSKGTVCNKVNPDVYVRVASFLDWIEEATETL